MNLGRVLLAVALLVLLAGCRHSQVQHSAPKTLTPQQWVDRYCSPPHGERQITACQAVIAKYGVPTS